MNKVACQTIVYGNPVIKDTIASILENVKKNGYDGVETGARHFYLDRPEFYKELFAKNELEFTAIHVGGDFVNPDSVKDQITNIAGYISFAKELNAHYVYISGTYKDSKTVEDYHVEAGVMTEIGKRCADAGLKLCYHNHHWEFWNNRTGMDILLDKVPEEYMKLVPDVGWVTVGGVNPVDFLNENLSRVEAVHFKDFKNTKDPNSFTELGSGIVDFKGVYELLREKKENCWITAEQDVATEKPEISSKVNCEYIRSLF